MIGVSWYEADAYCYWLSERTNLSYRLPWAKAWEKAAANPKGEYPWGDDDPNPELLNFDENVGAPTPVGIYPAGATPGGHLDMAGNVWEWNSDLLYGSPYPVVRGGSWDSVAPVCRSAFSSDFPPDDRDYNLGFRLFRSVSLGP